MVQNPLSMDLMSCSVISVTEAYPGAYMSQLQCFSQYKITVFEVV